jgi:hypothetical protein
MVWLGGQKNIVTKVISLSGLWFKNGWCVMPRSPQGMTPLKDYFWHTDG